MLVCPVNRKMAMTRMPLLVGTLGTVIVVGDVADPVQAVLDAPGDRGRSGQGRRSGPG